MEMSAAERKLQAARAGVDEQYLYQCLTGRKAMRADQAVRVEAVSERRIRRWELRQHDWHLIWPELIGIEGAPKPVPIGGTSAEASNAAA